MLRLKSVRLQNYCGYSNTTFNFCPNGRWIPMAIFFGPNGVGKSSCLNALRLLLSAKDHKGRDMDLLLRSLVYNQDYNPDNASIRPPVEHMLVDGIFDYNGEEKRVTLKASYWEEKYTGQKPDPVRFSDETRRLVLVRPCGSMEDENNENWILTFFSGGFVRNDLESKTTKSILFVDADNPMNMKKFQIPESRSKQFKDIAEAVYGYPCIFSAKVTVGNGSDSIDFFTDFILEKGGGKTKVHFKRMSDGEKKIATMIRSLCNPSEIDEPDMVLIDNIEMHIYFKRHARLIEKLIDTFPHKQFFATTHSAILIQHVMERNADRNEPNWLFDIEQYKPEEAMTVD